MFIGDKDLKRIHHIDKRNRRVLAVLCDGLWGIDYDDEIIRIALEVDFGLLHTCQSPSNRPSGKCGVVGMGCGGGGTVPSPRGMLY